MYAPPKTTAEDKALFKRAAAARELAERGVLDGAAGLGFALWPTRAIEAAAKQAVAGAGREREAELDSD